MGTNCVDHNRYDDEGNLTKKSKAANDTTWTYGWDNNNQLTWVEKRATDGGTLQMRAEYKYDVFGNRIEKAVDEDGAGGGGTVTTRFAVDGWKTGGGRFKGNENFDVWADLDSSNNLDMRRLYTNEIDGVVARIDDGGTEAWYYTDRLGSVREMVNDSGTLKNVIAYDGFLGINSESDSTFGDRYKATARERDTETGLQFHRRRYYDSRTGRWISQDPIPFAAADPNLYRYVGNKTTNYLDPSGLDGGPIPPQVIDEVDRIMRNPNHKYYRFAEMRLGPRATRGDIREFLLRESEALFRAHNELLKDPDYSRRLADAKRRQLQLEKQMQAKEEARKAQFWNALQAMNMIGEGITIAACPPSGIIFVGLHLAADDAEGAKRAVTETVVSGGTRFSFKLAGKAWARLFRTTNGARGPKRIYSARELTRRAAEPGAYHNFPESLNKTIFQQGTKTRVPNFFNRSKPGLSNDSIQYRYPGTVNGREGVYEIFTRPSTSGNTEVIVHRFFRPNP